MPATMSDTFLASFDTRFRRIGSRLAAILFGIILGWLLIEILLRVTFPWLPALVQAPLRHVRQSPFTERTILPIYPLQPVDVYQYAILPGLDNTLLQPNPDVSFHVTTKNWLDPNSHIGFRVGDAQWEPRWPIDAVIVGDSFSFCFTEFDDCWTEQLDDLNVVNLGIGATGSVSHLNVLTTFGMPYQPKMVIWQWYGNDFNEDYGLENRHAKRENEDQAATWQSADSVSVNWLRANSGLFSLLDTLVFSKSSQKQYELQRDRYSINHAGIDLTIGRPYVLETADLSDEKNQIGQALTEKAILEAKTLLADAGIEFVVILMPWKEEAYRHLAEEKLGVEKLEQLSQGRQAMLTFCAQNKLECLDMTPALTAAVVAGENVYLPTDIHLNAAGNRVAAETLMEFLAGR